MRIWNSTGPPAAVTWLWKEYSTAVVAFTLLKKPTLWNLTGVVLVTLPVRTLKPVNRVYWLARPAGPEGPGTPWAPCGPAGPWGPVAPTGPCGPGGPGGPWTP